MVKDIKYYRAINNTTNSTIQQSELYEAQNALNYDFDTNPSCKDVLMNGEPTKAIVYIDTDIVTGGQSWKIELRPNQVLNIGDIFIIDGETWFCTKVMINRMINYSGTLAKSTCLLRFYKNGILRELPCYITVGTRNYINEYENYYLRTPASLYTAYCPDLGYLDKTDANMRIYIRGYIYRIMGVDNLTVLDGEVREGLIIMKFKDDSISSDDNMELGIANYWSNQPENIKQDELTNNVEYKLSLDTEQNNISLGETLNIQCIVKDNNDKVIDKECTYSICDENGNNIIDYIKLTQSNNVCTLVATTKGKYVGKKFYLVVTLNDENVKLERCFNIKSIL